MVLLWEIDTHLETSPHFFNQYSEVDLRSHRMVWVEERFLRDRHS